MDGRSGQARGRGGRGWVLAPAFDSNEEALEALSRAIEVAGFRPGEDVAISLDIVASEFERDGLYRLARDGRSLKTGEMIEMIAGWLGRYPIVSVEDPPAEDDLEGLAAFTSATGPRVQVVAGDAAVTDAERLRALAALGACNAMLIKPNQIGTLTGARAALDAARDAGWGAVVSARSGETEDVTIVHLAVGWGVPQLKVGSFSRSERMAKWNEGLRIGEALPGGFALPDPAAFHPGAFLEGGLSLRQRTGASSPTGQGRRRRRPLRPGGGTRRGQASGRDRRCRRPVPRPDRPRRLRRHATPACPVLQALGARVIYANRRDAGEPYARVDKSTLLAEADVLSFHILETLKTVGWLDADATAAMKSGAIVVDTARGTLVDEAALANTLRSGHLAGAGFGVFVEEPADPDHPLLSLPTVTALPHVASLTRETLERSLTVVMENCSRLADGRDLLHRGLIAREEVR